MSRLHYKKFPKCAVHWKGKNRKKVLEFCKEARIEGDSVFISDSDGDIVEAEKGKYIINKRGNFWTADPRELKYFLRPRKAEKSRKYNVDIHSLRVWARYLRKNRETWVKLL